MCPKIWLANLKFSTVETADEKTISPHRAVVTSARMKMNLSQLDRKFLHISSRLLCFEGSSRQDFAHGSFISVNTNFF